MKRALTTGALALCLSLLASEEIAGVPGAYDFSAMLQPAPDALVVTNPSVPERPI